jgi:hypothetical protein
MISDFHQIDKKPAFSRLFHAFFQRWSVGLILTGILTAGWWLPLEALPSWSGCLLKRISGWACPGCGLTRAFLVLSRGQIMQAFQFNPAGPLLYAAFSMAWLLQFFPKGSQVRAHLVLFWERVRAPVSLMIVGLLFGHWLIKILARGLSAG